MTLEQRVEALEKTVKVLAGRDFAVDGGRVFINEAFIQEGATKSGPETGRHLLLYVKFGN